MLVRGLLQRLVEYAGEAQSRHGKLMVKVGANAFDISSIEDIVWGDTAASKIYCKMVGL